MNVGGQCRAANLDGLECFKICRSRKCVRLVMMVVKATGALECARLAAALWNGASLLAWCGAGRKDEDCPIDQGMAWNLRSDSGVVHAVGPHSRKQAC